MANHLMGSTVRETLNNSPELANLEEYGECLQGLGRRNVVRAEDEGPLLCSVLELDHTTT